MDTENIVIEVTSQDNDKDLLCSCLVGRFCCRDETLTHSEVESGRKSAGREGPVDNQVYDMNGFHFLFEFQSMKAKSC